MPNEQKVNIKKFYQNSSKPRNYVPSALVTSPPEYPPVMSGLMQINPETKDIWISAGKELVSDWINVTGAGSSGTIAIQDNGTPISAAATILNFVGATSVSGDPNVTITIPTGPIIFKNTIPGAVNSSPGEKTSYIVQIPGKTIKEGSVVRIHYRSRMLSDTFASNFVQPTIRISSNPSGATGTMVGYDRFQNPSTSTTVSQMTRTFIVSNDLKTYALDDKNFYSDDNTQRGIEAVLAIDWTITQYIKFNIDIPVGPGSAQGVFYLIEIF